MLPLPAHFEQAVANCALRRTWRSRSSARRIPIGTWPPSASSPTRATTRWSFSRPVTIRSGSSASTSQHVLPPHRLGARSPVAVAEERQHLAAEPLEEARLIRRRAVEDQVAEPHLDVAADRLRLLLGIAGDDEPRLGADVLLLGQPLQLQRIVDALLGVGRQRQCAPRSRVSWTARSWSASYETFTSSISSSASGSRPAARAPSATAGRSVSVYSSARLAAGGDEAVADARRRTGRPSARRRRSGSAPASGAVVDRGPVRAVVLALEADPLLAPTAAGSARSPPAAAPAARRTAATRCPAAAPRSATRRCRRRGRPGRGRGSPAWRTPGRRSTDAAACVGVEHAGADPDSPAA